MVRRSGIAAGNFTDARVVEELTDRVVRRLRDDQDRLEVLLNEAFYLEDRRLRKKRSDPERAAELSELREMRRAFPHAGAETRRRMAGRLVGRYAREIHGHFDPRMYRVATTVLPRLLGLLLGRQSLRNPRALLRGGSLVEQLQRRVKVSGELAQIDRLIDRGTVILVPTHLSNLDSPLVGWGLHAAGLPPMIYGAGINLFENGVLARFMDTLGAYKVDREKKHTLYKLALKEYSGMALGRGWHSLFFPGGTRSRSGAVETRVKKGLLGTGLTTYSENIAAGVKKPNIYIVPLNINYHLVLEAETLIEDHLKEWGKSRYIIVDDEFSRPRLVARFAWNSLRLEDSIDLHFGRALDVFGNDVDDEGESLDPKGRPIDPRRFITRGGQVTQDPVRDRLYTDQLAGRVVDRFLRGNQIMVTHVLAGVLHGMVREAHPRQSIYERLRLPEPERSFERSEVARAIDRLLSELRRLADRGAVRLGPDVAGGDADRVIDKGLDLFGRFHRVPAVEQRGTRLVAVEPRLVLYYRNRLLGYGLMEREQVYQDALPPGYRGGGEAAVARAQ